MHAFLATHQHVATYALQGLRTCFWLVLVTGIFGPLEHLFSVRKAKLLYEGWSVNLGWYFLNSLTPIFLLGPPAALLAWGIHQVLPAEVTRFSAALPLWARFSAAMVVGEIGFYWGHRWCHEIPFLWRFHAVHHSARHISFLVNTRAHPVDMVFTRLCGMVLLYATGLASPVGPHPALIPSLVLLVGSLWSFFIHANLRWRLGWFEEVIASPAFHHWHHTLEDHKDHNYAAMLPFMDRVFGTFHLPKAWPTAYGTQTPMPATVTGQLLEPFTPAARAVTAARTTQGGNTASNAAPEASGAA
jgi:sterol desaturase/sphingolipid hydroxylase (fatty acid hydroxylase superfamily)